MQCLQGCYPCVPPPPNQASLYSVVTVKGLYRSQATEHSCIQTTSPKQLPSKLQHAASKSVPPRRETKIVREAIFYRIPEASCKGTPWWIWVQVTSTHSILLLVIWPGVPENTGLLPHQIGLTLPDRQSCSHQNCGKHQAISSLSLPPMFLNILKKCHKGPLVTIKSFAPHLWNT